MIIKISNFSKTYRTGLFTSVNAVSNLSLNIKEGSCVGLLGENGAGKTTTIRALLGLLFPSTGCIEVMGSPPGDPAVLRRIGYLPEIYPIFKQIKLDKQVRFFSKLQGLDKKKSEAKIDTLFDQMNLAQDKKKRGAQLSKGKVQRFGLVQALLNDPDILLLDEPTTGLDPAGRILFHDIILNQKQQNKTILFSSHIISDLEKLCDTVLVIHGGALLKTIDLKEPSRVSLEEQYRKLISTGEK